MRPLDNITVVALEQAVAAPFATRQLADLGARVIKIERPNGGDFARGYDETVKGMSSHFVWLNRSKESLTLDLKHSRAAPILERLLERADVVIQNLAPGAARRLGLGAESLLPKYPRLIVCDISGYGDNGPYAAKKAYDLLVQAEAGVLSVTGTADAPSKVGISIGDIAAGMYAYSAILTALYQREKSGKGTRISGARRRRARVPITRRSYPMAVIKPATVRASCSGCRMNANGLFSVKKYCCSLNWRTIPATTQTQSAPPSGPRLTRSSAKSLRRLRANSWLSVLIPRA